MEESMFFEQGGVSVSNARFIVHGQIYAMNGVTSVKKAVDPAFRIGPIGLGMLGLLLVLNGGAALVIGGVILAIALLWWKVQSPT